MRRHHEEIAAAPAIIPLVTALIPMGIAFWVRVKDLRQKPGSGDARPESQGDL